MEESSSGGEPDVQGVDFEEVRGGGHGGRLAFGAWRSVG